MPSATAVIPSTHSIGSVTWSTRWNSESRSVGSTVPAIARRRVTSAIGSSCAWTTVCAGKSLPAVPAALAPSRERPADTGYGGARSSLAMSEPSGGELLDNEVIRNQKKKLESAESELARVDYFKKLLYERGDALEPVVRRALEELGADVQEPTEPGREDARVTDPAGRNAIVEIKGRTGALKIADVRQLDQWVRDAIAEEDWEGKGLLVANTFADNDPESRPDPFPANTIRTAERFELA